MYVHPEIRTIQILQVTTAQRSSVKYHRSCYKKGKRVVRLDDDHEQPSTSFSPKKTRSVVQLTFDNKLCVFCQATGKKESLALFCTDKAQKTVGQAIAKTTNHTIKGRLEGVDLTAAEVKYHKKCYSSFLKNIPSGVADNKSERDGPISDGLTECFIHFREVWENGKAVTADMLADYYNSRHPVREKRNLLQSFTTRYSQEIMMLDVSCKEKLLVSKRFSLLDLINAVRDEKENVTDNGSIVTSAAKALAKDIKECWQPIEGFTITQESISKVIPESLLDFLNAISSEGSSSKKKSIALDIIGLCLRRVPPTHVTLASSVKHLTGSKELISQLCAMGHSCSYTELLRLETAAAKGEMEYAKEHGVVIPPIIQPAERGLLQAAADNDDFMEETIDGKNTTHGTTMVLLQHLGAFAPTLTRPVSKTRQTSLEKDELRNLLSIQKAMLPKGSSFPGFRESRAIRMLLNTDYAQTPGVASSYTLDMEWILNRLAPSKFFDLDIVPSSQSCPSWSSWNARGETTRPELKAVIGYCPMLNAKSDDPSTVYTVLLQLKKIMGILGQKHSIITFDLAIYKVAKEVVWSRPQEFQHTIIRLGGFHVILNYLGALGNMLNSSGVIGLMSESGVFTNTTIKHILAGGNYKRGVRFHKLLYEALLRKKLEALKQWLMVTDREDPLENLDLSDRHTDEELTQAAEVLIAQMQMFDSVSPEDSQVLKFWNLYLRTAQTLLSLIRAERSGNWSLYIESLTSMLPMFYAYDRVNYSRWLPIYICDMVDLEENAPEVHKEFLLGKFSINRTGNPYAAVLTDMVLKQTLNKDSKGAGGLNGITL